MKIKLSDLRKAYDKAVAEKQKTFILKVGDEDYLLLDNYAKYLIQHLENEYKKRNLKENVPLFEFTNVPSTKDIS